MKDKLVSLGVALARKSQNRVSELWLMLFAALALIPLYILDARSPHLATVAVSTSAQKPLFSPPGGYYDHDIQIEIGFPSNGADIVFTLDGSIPTLTVGTVYAHPIQVSAAMPSVIVVRARAVLSETELGPVASASYFVGVPATLPMLSLIVDPSDLWDVERGIYANPFEKGTAWERPVDVTLIDRDRHSGFHVPAGLRIHGGATRSSAKKAFRLYFRSEYGVNRLEYPLFAGGEIQSFKRLVLHNGGQDSPRDRWDWTLLRSQLVGDLATQIGGCAARGRPGLVFLNGEPWGIYQIREYIDRWFLADHYGIQSADLLDTPAVRGSQAVIEGDREHWDHVVRFIETHDLADQVSYAYVQTQMDLANLSDYAILQIYSANRDWLDTNLNQFRPRVPGGRWRWFFWDSDHSLDLQPHTDTIAIEAFLLRKLLENPGFRHRFLTRTADLLNTALSPEAVIARIDALANEIAPDLAHETGRWSKPTYHWETNVQALRDFARMRPDELRRNFVRAFDLDGTASLTVNPAPVGAGYVAINGALLPGLPWQGVYFGGTDVQLTAVPAPGYRRRGTGLPVGMARLSRKTPSSR